MMRQFISLFTLLTTLTLSSQTLDIYGPGAFSDILNRGFSEEWTPAAASAIENRQYFILMDAATKQNVIAFGDEDFTLLSIEDVSSISSSTYGSVLRSIFQMVDINTNSSEDLSGEYQIRSSLHTYYALNLGGGDDVNLSDAGSYYVENGDAYLVFEFDGIPSSVQIEAAAQMEYNVSIEAFEENPSWESQWLLISEGKLKLTSDSESATDFFMANPFDLVDFSLPSGSDFNPKETDWQDNAFAAYPDEVWTYEESALFGDQFFMEVDESYQTQFGNDAAANTAASEALDQIEIDLIADEESLRYDKEVYLEFRDNLLSRTFAATDMYNAIVGENTISYVYFTNASDDEGVRHPFMVIASHNASDGANFLIDVARPPGDGNGAGYEEQGVTRNAILEVKLIKIPLKDYGLIDELEDNDLSEDGTLAEDLGLTSEDFDVYNYAARASNGIAIDGVVIYPSYNNNLRFASMDAEITSTGIHVGRGMGLHYHADGHGFNGNGLNLYNIEDYDGTNHPPIIGFAYDGVALFGKYEDGYSDMEGYMVELDEFGGHDHDIGYHYHAFGKEVTVEDDMEGTVGPFTQHFLLVGAWKGYINEIPAIFEGSTAQLKDETVGRFAGASYDEIEEPSPTLGVDSEEWGVVYPNPNTGSFKIIGSGISKVTLADISGKVLETRMNPDSSELIFERLEKGVYILTLERAQQSMSRRIVIE